jgi:hypothetical protein
MSSPDLKWMIGGSIGEVCLVEPASWWFRFAGGGAIRADTLWRVVASGRIQATSKDHGQRFGLTQAVDSAVRASHLVASAVVRRASVAGDTGDVIVDFDNDSRLEILTTSSGYESWAVFFPNGDEAIGLGGGNVHFRKRG